MEEFGSIGTVHQPCVLPSTRRDESLGVQNTSDQLDRPTMSFYDGDPDYAGFAFRIPHALIFVYLRAHSVLNDT